jgi:hypothetical protein
MILAATPIDPPPQQVPSHFITYVIFLANSSAIDADESLPRPLIASFAIRLRAVASSVPITTIGLGGTAPLTLRNWCGQLVAIDE